MTILGAQAASLLTWGAPPLAASRVKLLRKRTIFFLGHTLILVPILDLELETITTHPFFTSDAKRTLDLARMACDRPQCG